MGLYKCISSDKISNTFLNLLWTYIKYNNKLSMEIRRGNQKTADSEFILSIISHQIIVPRTTVIHVYTCDNIYGSTNLFR